MDEPSLPRTPKGLGARLRRLREARQHRQAKQRRTQVRRRSLTKAERDAILKKTAGRCHLCGGKIITDWEADHVLAHSGGGIHHADNYLPAHTLCNNYRWDYLPEEFQWALKIGVWARLVMEKRSDTGLEMLQRFHRHDARRTARRRPRSTASQP